MICKVIKLWVQPPGKGEWRRGLTSAHGAPMFSGQGEDEEEQRRQRSSQ